MQRIGSSLLVIAVVTLSLACADKAPTRPVAAGVESASEQSAASAGRRPAPHSLAPRQSAKNGLIGTWGGDHVRITIGAASSIVEYDCAHGSIDQPFALDSAGRFDLAGTHVLEGPGPIREDQPPVTHPARYTGSTDGNTMTLSLTLTDSGQVLGPFTLALGAPGRLVKCY